MNLLFSNDKQGQYPDSWYAATTPKLDAFPELTGEHRADVCVIGGGYTGLSAALHLAQLGRKVILLEAHRVGFGASGRNGGQMSSGQRVDQDTLEDSFGLDAAHALWDMGEAAKTLCRDLIKTHSIDCDLRNGVAEAEIHTRHLPAMQKYAKKLSREYNYDQLECFEGDAFRELVKSPTYQGGMLDHGSAHLNPLAFTLGLARAAQMAGVTICENTEVTNVDQGSTAVVHSKLGKVRAENVIFGCNGYLGDISPKVAKRVMPINNFIVATSPLADPSVILGQDIAVADSKFVVNYFRLSPDNRLLFGGRENYGYRFPRDIAAKVRVPMEQIFPQLAGIKIDYSWGGTLGITTNRMPAFLRISDNMLAAGGYSGQGVALAVLAGKLMADTIQGQDKSFNLMANLPQMGFPGGPRMRSPLLKMAMLWYVARDKLGL